MRTKAAALALAATITTLIAQDDTLAGYQPLVTLDPEAAAGALSADSQLVALVVAPTLTYTTWTSLDARFDVHLIAGQPGDMLAAWDILDNALDALATPLGADEAEPASYPNPAGPPWPAYTLTLTQPYQP
ncbi:MAG: hypothetical protein QM708_13530 [Propioniciclava sp.]|uniref:hypothetical protein n=1 Tax=Propioniciclava sp. TaxID=2038686 RepID=UPI0039E498F3